MTNYLIEDLSCFEKDYVEYDRFLRLISIRENIKNGADQWQELFTGFSHRVKQLSTLGKQIDHIGALFLSS